MPAYIPYIGNIPSNDDDLMATWAQSCANGYPMILEPKTYYPTVPQVFDLGLCRTTGTTIKGQGIQKSIIDTSRMTVTDAAVQFINASGTADNYYLHAQDFAIAGNSNKTLLRVGKRDFSDPVNEAEFTNVWVGGGAVDSNSCIVELNYVCNSKFDMVVNCNNSFWGTPLRLRQCVFSNFQGSYSNGNVGIELMDGYNYGNVFSACDIEQVQVCVSIDSPNAVDNTFVGGQFSYKYFGIRGTAGSSNKFLNPHPQPLPGAIQFIQSSTGLVVM